MNESLRPRDCDVAIIGGGAGGVLAALQLLRQARDAIRIVLVSAQMPLGDGVAYATRRPEHLLNVPAGKMSAYPDRADDFVAFLAGQPEFSGAQASELAERYVPRRHYADYLRARLQQIVQESRATFEVIHAQVLELDKRGDTLRLRLDRAGDVFAASAVLAVGNTARRLPNRGATELERRHLVEAWDNEALDTIPIDATVCIVGSGLSMADVVATLHARAHRGLVHVVSRHGLMPLVHVHGAELALDLPELLSLPLRARMRTLRQHARQAVQRGIPWQSLMNTLRPHGQALWTSLCAADQRRFLRHVARYWDLHRHRIAPLVHSCLQTLLASGQLRVHHARLDTVFPAGDYVQLNGRGALGDPLRLDAQRIVNATGLELRVPAMRNPLLLRLLGLGHAEPGPHGIGVATDTAGWLVDAGGHADVHIQVLGSLRIGGLGESLAIPELREQARAAATALLPR